MRADAESSCTASCTDSWSQDGARNPWSAPTTELWAPTGRYDLHSGLTHLGEGSIGIRLPRDISDFRDHPNIELEKMLPAIREAVIVLWGYLRRIAECWGLDSPDERVQPLVNTIIEASRQPEGTLPFMAEN